MTTKTALIGVMILFAMAIAIAMIIAMVRDVQADKRDVGGTLRGRPKRFDILKRDDDTDEPRSPL